MVNQTAQLRSAADLEKMPANGVRYELVKGELRTMPPAGGEHGAIGMNLSGPMHAHAKANDLGVVLLAETGFILKRGPDTVRAADIAFVRKERIPHPSNGNPQVILARPSRSGGGGRVAGRYALRS